MSKIIAANVIAGAHKVYEKAGKRYEKAVKKPHLNRDEIDENASKKLIAERSPGEW